MSSQSVPVAVIAAAELRHELRTPLNHIIGYSEILLDEYPDAELDLPVREIRKQADEMLAEIQRIAGTDKTAVPVSALETLRTSLDAGIARVRELSGTVRARLPETAHADLARIATAIDGLMTALAGKARSSAPVPVALKAKEEAATAAGRILIVDDNELNRDMLLRQLERQGHEVAAAADGPAALSMLRSSRFDILLLDLMMPGMNGFEVLAAVKEDAALSCVAVILISALDEMEGVVRSIEAGAEDYLFKPVNPTLLRARIKNTLDKLRAEDSLRRKQRLESVGLLAAGIAHDFNNLLTGIIGHAQLLDQALTSAEDREMAQSIVTAGERAADLTRQLLAYSGKAMFQMQPVDLALLLRENERLIKASLPKHTKLQLNVTSACTITADKNQLLQALLNLSINAAEAIGPDCIGTVTIECGVERLDAGVHFDVMPDEVRSGWYSWFEVRDDGCGMDTETVSKIFEPFYSTKFLGRGLGLAAVAGIVRSHKGMLRVTSTPGTGSSMRAYFPTAPGAEPPETPRENVILVVDDEPVIRQIVKVALERSGRSVLLADSGEAAVEIVSRMQDQIKLVLLDWKMPMMDGGETLLRLRAIKPDLRVIVSSGFALSEAEESYREVGITGYLQKPYRMSELVDLVAKTASK